MPEVSSSLLAGVLSRSQRSSFGTISVNDHDSERDGISLIA
jgi:hypothetical protein